MDYLFDTNHATSVMASAPVITAKMRQAQFHGHQFGISTTVLAELFYAVYNSQKRKQNSARLQSFRDQVDFWPFDEAAAEEFGIIRVEVKSKGRPMPVADVQIAAVARVNNLTVLTADRHFTYVPNLKHENWLT
ncbi:MAG: type II toxin-antitoxin system VapC family toxin [Chloroflexota bacterium]